MTRATLSHRRDESDAAGCYAAHGLPRDVKLYGSRPSSDNCFLT